jgi:hypothetical protein
MNHLRFTTFAHEENDQAFAEFTQTLQIPASCILIGDSDCRHHWWYVDTAIKTYHYSRNVELVGQGVTLQNMVGRSTHFPRGVAISTRQRCIIDLCFRQGQITEPITTLTINEESTSDHALMGICYETEDVENIKLENHVRIRA